MDKLLTFFGDNRFSREVGISRRTWRQLRRLGYNGVSCEVGQPATDVIRSTGEVLTIAEVLADNIPFAGHPCDDCPAPSLCALCNV